jgi:hypothetical protein
LTHGPARHTSGINALRKRTRYLWLFGLTPGYHGVLGSYYLIEKDHRLVAISP